MYLACNFFAFQRHMEQVFGVWGQHRRYHQHSKSWKEKNTSSWQREYSIHICVTNMLAENFYIYLADFLM